VRTFRATSGPFAERTFIPDAEIEHTCEDELRKFGFFPSKPEPIRIERFIEKRFNVTPRHEDLPDGVLGFSCFGRGGMESMHINRRLTEEGTRAAERLANSTLAHEAGHGLFQAYLFALAADGLTLFGSDPDFSATKILCRQETRDRRYDGRWWELQAQKAIGPLLMPRALVGPALEPLLVQRGTFGIPAVDEAHREDAAQLLAETFDVNPAAARVRLAAIYPSSGAQLTL
jgi:hypothetical protein